MVFALFFWHREDRARQVLKGYLHEKPCSGDLREPPKKMQRIQPDLHIKIMLETQKMCFQHFQGIIIITLKLLADRSRCINFSLRKNIF